MTETVAQPAETAPESAAVSASAPSSNTGRYSLNDDGQIFFQPDATNPLPGSPVGRLVKGASLLQPKTDHAAAQEWLDIHVRAVLEPLFLLKQEAGEGTLTGAARDIGDRLYDHLGVVHRADLEDVIPGLDADLRKLLRGKGVRLGPILAFLPALVKPAAVKMRALLWGLWNDKTLPVARPADGRVSEVVDAAAVDRGFYRMIGYPVFGPRAIRIDMLDRVVTDVYDTAKDGIFEAKHRYAEWLGCNLDDLHAVLESMGHRKLKTEAPVPEADIPAAETPAPETPVVESAAVEEAAEEKVAADDAPVADVPQDMSVVSEAVAGVVTSAGAAPKAPPVVVRFMLKRGKMSERPQSRRPQRPERAKDGEKSGGKPKFEKKKAFDPNKAPERGDRPKKPKFDRNRDRDRDDSREGRVYTFEGKKAADDDDGNPFAILKKLK